VTASRDPLRAIVVDDEPLARRTLRSFLSRHDDVTIAAECANGRDAIAAIRAHRPDVVFLDIQMPGVTGFDVIAEIGPGEMPFVIFVTAYDTHLLEAFDVHAVDYLLKPFTDERFEAALAHARTRLRERSAADLAATLAGLVAAPPRPPAGLEPLQRFMVPADGRILFVRASDVDWIEAEDYYVCLHAGGARHLIRETMAALESQVDPAQFVRVHRSAMVNVDYVTELRPLSKGECTVRLRDGTEIRVSRGRRAALEAALRRRA
jgi:two-component system, LytTR family, response regulator